MQISFCSANAKRKRVTAREPVRPEKSGLMKLRPPTERQPVFVQHVCAECCAALGQPDYRASPPAPLRFERNRGNGRQRPSAWSWHLKMMLIALHNVDFSAWHDGLHRYSLGQCWWDGARNIRLDTNSRVHVRSFSEHEPCYFCALRYLPHIFRPTDQRIDTCQRHNLHEVHSALTFSPDLCTCPGEIGGARTVPSRKVTRHAALNYAVNRSRTSFLVFVCVAVDDVFMLLLWVMGVMGR